MTNQEILDKLLLRQEEDTEGITVESRCSFNGTMCNKYLVQWNKNESDFPMQDIQKYIKENVKISVMAIAPDIEDIGTHQVVPIGRTSRSADYASYTACPTIPTGRDHENSFSTGFGCSKSRTGGQACR